MKTQNIGLLIPHGFSYYYLGSENILRGQSLSVSEDKPWKFGICIPI